MVIQYGLNVPTHICEEFRGHIQDHTSHKIREGHGHVVMKLHIRQQATLKVTHCCGHRYSLALFVLDQPAVNYGRLGM